MNQDIEIWDWLNRLQILVLLIVVTVKKYISEDVFKGTERTAEMQWFRSVFKTSTILIKYSFPVQ